VQIGVGECRLRAFYFSHLSNQSNASFCIGRSNLCGPG
jgi:hypothetical protein